MPNQFSVDVPNVLQALMAGEQGYDSVTKRLAENEMKSGRIEAMQALQNGDDLRSPLAKLIGIGDHKGAEAIAAFAKSHAEGSGVYGTPIYGTGPNGENLLSAITKDGKLKPLTQDGFTPSPGVKMIDTGTGTMVVNSRSGAQVGAPAATSPVPGQPPQMGQATQPQRPVGYVPKDIAGEAREKQYGKEVGDRQADLGKAKAALETNVSNLDRMAQQANELLTHKGIGRITGLYGVLPDIPGFPGADAQAKLQTLQAQSGFSTLQSMRDASKTGGALGSVTEGEHKLLQSYLAELTRAQSEKQFRSALGKIVSFTEGAKDRLRQAYEQDYSNIPRPNPSSQPTTVTGPSGAQSAPATKSLNGKNYIQFNGQWFEQ